MKSDVTFLTIEQIFGDKKLDLFDQIEAKATVTDYALLLGAYVNYYFYVGEEKLENRTGWYWTKSDYEYNEAQSISSYGNEYWLFVRSRDVAARPALPYSSIFDITANRVYNQNLNGVLVGYGTYPQKAVNKEKQIELENVFGQNNLKQTGHKFTVDSRRYNEYDKPFKAKELLEYEYQGKYYVRVKANLKDKVQLSNGEYYRDGDYVWVEVSPVKWYLDEKSGLMISQNLLFAGIQFHHERNYKGDFSKTDIQKYLNHYFAKELRGDNVKEEIRENKEKENNSIEVFLNQIQDLEKHFLEKKEELLGKLYPSNIQDKEKIKQLKK